MTHYVYGGNEPDSVRHEKEQLRERLNQLQLEHDQQRFPFLKRMHELERLYPSRQEIELPPRAPISEGNATPPAGGER